VDEPRRRAATHPAIAAMESGPNPGIHREDEEEGFPGSELTPGIRAKRRRASGLSLAERTLRARAAAHRLHSLYDSRDLTEKARGAFNGRFLREVDPQNRLPESERLHRAESARKAYFTELAAKSARARRLRRAQ
jgi:hypothetical protein